MPNIGPMEIAIVLLIALLVFGPRKLPQLGRSLGQGITEFRDGLSSVDRQPAPVEAAPQEALPEASAPGTVAENA